MYTYNILLWILSTFILYRTYLLVYIGVCNFLQGRIFYEEIGDYPAQTFFAVDNTTGDVKVIDNLASDSLKLSFFQVSCCDLSF